MRNVTRPLESLEDLRNTVRDSNAETVELNNSFSGLGVAAGAGADAAKAKLTDLQRVMERLRFGLAEATETRGMTEAQKAAWQAQREAGVSADSAQGREIASLTEQTFALNKNSDAWTQMGQAANQTFGAILTGSGNAADAVKNMVNQIVASMMNSGLNSLWSAIGNSFAGSGQISNALSFMGVGANANGTPNWRGGFTWLNERGGEIVDLPNGSKIIPHDISKRMIDAGPGGGAQRVEVGIDPRNGNVTGYVRNEAGAMDAQSYRITQRTMPGHIANMQGRGLTS